MLVTEYSLLIYNAHKDYPQKPKQLFVFYVKRYIPLRRLLCIHGVRVSWPVRPSSCRPGGADDRDAVQAVRHGWYTVPFHASTPQAESAPQSKEMRCWRDLSREATRSSIAMTCRQQVRLTRRRTLKYSALVSRHNRSTGEVGCNAVQCEKRKAHGLPNSGNETCKRLESLFPHLSLCTYCTLFLHSTRCSSPVITAQITDAEQVPGTLHPRSGS